jgi:hypothetical protein
VSERFADILLVLENTIHRVETTGKGSPEQINQLKDVVQEIGLFIEEKVSNLVSPDLLSQIRELGVRPKEKEPSEEAENELPQKSERGSIKDPEFYDRNYARRLNFAEREKAILVAEALDGMFCLLQRSGFLYLSQSNLSEKERALYRLKIGQMMPFFSRIDEDLYSQHPGLSRISERESWEQLHKYSQEHDLLPNG